jgi:hypothetical protein
VPAIGVRGPVVVVNTIAETTSEIEIGFVATNTWRFIRGGAMGLRTNTNGDAEQHAEPHSSFENTNTRMPRCLAIAVEKHILSREVLD